MTSILFAGPALASPAGVDPTGDAHGGFAAVSGAGDAHAGPGAGCDYAPEPVIVPCVGVIAVSGTGDARADYVAVSGEGHADALVAVCVSHALACLPEAPVVTPPVLAAPLVTGVSLGPDEDGDGVPAFVRVERAEARVDTATGNADVVPVAPVEQRVDFNDANPRSPVPDPEDARPRWVMLLVPSGASVGPDGDADGVPAFVRVDVTLVIVNLERQEAEIVRGSPVFVTVDPDDGNAARPVPAAPASVSARVPSAVAPGPDADGDGVPGSILVAFTTLHVDTTTGDVTREDESVERVRLDPDDRAREVHVNPTGDAEGTFVAASGTGNATACEARVDCAAASGTGNARGYYAASGTGDATACTDVDFLCTAASGAGNARAGDLAASGTGNAEGGDAAASGAGAAAGTLPVSALGTCNGRACFSVVGGDADAHWFAATLDGDARGIVAVSVTGDADGGLVAVSAFGAADGPVAVDGGA